MNILDKIVARKRAEVAQQQVAVPVDQLPKRTDGVRDFKGALAKPGLQVIGEVKRKSPSLGVINADIDPATQARQYAAGGAAAISVLAPSRRCSEAALLSLPLPERRSANSACEGGRMNIIKMSG